VSKDNKNDGRVKEVVVVDEWCCKWREKKEVV
jgi:hypothetical protein